MWIERLLLRPYIDMVYGMVGTVLHGTIDMFTASSSNNILRRSHLLSSLQFALLSSRVAQSTTDISHYANTRILTN